MKFISRLIPLSLLAVPAFEAALAAGTNAAPADGVSTALQVTVTARKWAEPLQHVPGSVAVQGGADLEKSGARDLREAARTIPNLTLGEFTERRLTFPYVRGLGSGQNDPAVMTCIDGVPQLSYVTANQELLRVERIEYLRGPQGALYGSDTLGGVINIVPRLPARTLAGSVSLAAGDHGMYDGRFSVEGPLGGDGLLAAASGGYARRDGFTKNDYTGRDLDRREAWFGNAQIYLPDQGAWDFRLSVTSERDRDGDYALYSLDALRAHPFHASHDYQGGNDRDLVQPVFTANRRGDAADFTSITALQWWQTRDRTDLDATPFDLQRKDVKENSLAWIEELRLASPAEAPVKLGDPLDLHWLAGAFAFAADRTQRALTDYRPGGVGFGYWPFPFQMLDWADLRDTGVSLFGQTTFTVFEQWELGLGLRDDFTHREANLRRAVPPFPPMSTAAPARDFNRVTPSASLAYHVTSELMAYAKASQGYRAGGFNAAAPPGHEAYDQETSWNYEAGVKSAWWQDRLIVNADVFRTCWNRLQVNSHVPGGNPSDYYIENGGKAMSQGAEVELTARPCRHVELFGGGGLLDAHYRAGSQSADAPVGGHDLPFAPRWTWQGGVQLTHDFGEHLQAFVRAELNGLSRYAYDPSNAESQGAYTLARFRAGVAAGTWRIEGWVNNAFDRQYVPLAIPYGPGYYVGECGAPRTVGASLTKTF